ncbi:MAG: ABC transporter substrate-binding protein [Clostridia bacterium]|nr:ABC transporter substrate-binding protein [Clostridia bacterium]
MKKFVSLILCLMLVLGLAACGEPESVDLSQVKANVYALNGPTGMGLVPLMKDAKEGKGTLDYNISTVAANDEIVAKVVKGEADIAAVATNLASTLYAKTNGGIKVLAVNTLGTLSVVTKGEEITKISDLKGKTVYTTGQGANPEYITNYILEKNGLKAGEDVTINFVSQPAELVQVVAKNEKAIVIAPQSVATTITVKNADAKVVIDLNKEWEAVSDTKLVMGCIIARNEYIEQNPQAVEAFLKDYEASVKTVNEASDEIAGLCAEYGIVAAAPIAKKAIPFCNIVFETGKEMKTDLSAYLDFLYKANPKSVGGAVPADDFYYEK